MIATASPKATTFDTLSMALYAAGEKSFIIKKIAADIPNENTTEKIPNQKRLFFHSLLKP